MNRFYKEDDKSDVHNRFPDMFARKTVLSRLSKQYVNRSSDDSLLLDSFNRADDESIEESIQVEIEANANRELLPEPLKQELPMGNQQPVQASIPDCFQAGAKNQG